jgi:RNA polymerase sigma factor (sigma-70 family)
MERGPDLSTAAPTARDQVSQSRISTPIRSNPAADLGLIRDCLQGNERAWSSLIDRYKNLIFSIPVRSGISPDDATDIFQAVCLDLLCELPKLRHPQALPRWLVQVTYHKCVRWKADRDRYSADEIEDDEAETGNDVKRVPDELLYESERSQKIRQVLSELEPRCRQLIEALFFESPVRPYREVAQNLGLALGSIGSVRERCLERVRRLLEKAGLG